MVSTPTISNRNGHLMIDEFTKKVAVKIITRKNETIQYLQEYVTRSKEMGFKIKMI